MNEKPDIAALTALSTIVALRSFRKAAETLEVSPSTLSHMIRALEARLGVRLLHRTTRSVSPTEAGQRLAARLGPLLAEFDLALTEVDAFRSDPAGTLRINMSETAARLLLQEVVPEFLRCHPRLTLDIVTDGELIDIVAEGFDAGIRLGDAVPQDMVAVRIGGPTRFVAVASPGYLAGREAPSTPDDLLQHECIRVRMPSGKPYRWEFCRQGQERVVDVPGRLVLDHMRLMLEAAADGLGIAYVLERAARPFIDDGRVVVLLQEWCPEGPELFLYYAGARHVPAGLRAFIDLLKLRLGNPAHAPGTPPTSTSCPPPR